MDDIYRRKKTSEPRINEDSDHYGYNDSNTSGLGNIDGLPLQASDIDDIVYQAYRRKKSKKPKLTRKRCSCKRK